MIVYKITSRRDSKKSYQLILRRSLWIGLLSLFFLLVSFQYCENESPSFRSCDPRELYIELIKRVLANTIYEDPSCVVFSGRSVKRDQPFDEIKREYGLDWPSVAHTMIGKKRLDNIHFCAKKILEDQIPGDFIETGIWRGGGVILMRAILKAYGETERTVWAADSFQGMPPPKPKKYPADAKFDLSQFEELAVSLDEVKENFEKYDLLDDQVQFLEGLFSETLHKAPIDSLALLRLDGDLYESTMDALVSLYPKLSVGGYLIIDDYKIPSCRAAVQDYRAQYGIAEAMIPIDFDSVYWKKERDLGSN